GHLDRAVDTTYRASCFAIVDCSGWFLPWRLSTPGVKSIGPDSMRVNTRFASCSGGLGGLPQALYSMPRAPSRDTQLGQVRRSPVSLIGSCGSTAMCRLAASS